MAHHYTPATNNDVSRMSQGLERLDEITSPEKSFAAPQNRELTKQLRSARGQKIVLNTPRVAGARDPLRLLPNGRPSQSEFTPFLGSGAKKNSSRRRSGRAPGVHSSTSLLHDAHTPGLSRLHEISHLEGENTSSSAGRAFEHTPVPAQISSSAHSTPIAQLPGREAAGLVNDGNMMTLREQESIIDKIEKENFGLKMKIHFLEEALSKRGKEFNHAALKENTDLKVNRVTMQRELHRFKKNIAQAERDAEVYRLQLEDFKERIRRKQVDESVRAELEALRSENEKQKEQIKALEDERHTRAHQTDSAVKRLQDEIEDLQADLREKERLVDERDDRIDELKMTASKESNNAADVEDELDAARQEIDDLKQHLDKAEREAQEARDGRDEAQDEKRKAEEDLDELRDEMANKSFTTKGLSRQMEEKANRLEDELQDARERVESVERQLHETAEAERQVRERLRGLEREGASDLRRLQQEVDVAHQQRDTHERKLANMAKQVESLEQELQIKADEKDLLQTRHDALTKESADLQNDLAKSRAAIADLEHALDDERQRAARDDHLVRSQHKNEIDLLHEQIDGLHREVNAKTARHAAESDKWDAQRRTLEAAAQVAEEKAKGLQRTMDMLQAAQGTLSGRETKLQDALDSEKERHRQEEKVLVQQMDELRQDIAAKHSAAEASRVELNNAREELRISIRDLASLKATVAELEEEIEVLQADIEQEHDLAEQQKQKYSTTAVAEVQALRDEKQLLRNELADVNVELRSAKKAVKAAEEARKEAEDALENHRKTHDDTFNMDHEKRELKRNKLKLEKEVTRLTGERDKLADMNRGLEEEINSELDRAAKEEGRLNAAIASLRAEKSNDGRDRELASTLKKAARLESRVQELEALLDQQSRPLASPGEDVAGLKADLALAQRHESDLVQREAQLKVTSRDLKMRINDLERELHDAKLAQYKSQSPSLSPAPSHTPEAAKIRKELRQAQAEINALTDENDSLKKKATRLSVTDENASRDLQAVAKCEKQIKGLKAQIRRMQDEQEAVHDLSMRLSTRDGEAREMKQQLRRLRDERRVASQKAEAVEKELEALQGQYESMLEKLTAGQHGNDEVREKEMKGLVKEIGWLKAKCRREERLRKDLAWSKAYLEQGEAMRVHCNQLDLRILGEMGVSLAKQKYQAKLSPTQKFRAGAFAVMAAIRMSNSEADWRQAKLLGEEVKLMRAKQTKPRTRTRIFEI